MTIKPKKPALKVCATCRYVNHGIHNACGKCGLPLAKPSKHKNVPTIVDGLRFDSKREAARWQQLKLLERAGKIADLERQVVFELAPSVQYAGKRATPALRYVADFAYFEYYKSSPRHVDAARYGCYTVEDSKGMRTPTYKIKRHLMLVVHKIEVRET